MLRAQQVMLGDGHFRPQARGDGGNEIAFLVAGGVKDIAAVEAVEL